MCVDANRLDPWGSIPRGWPGVVTARSGSDEAIQSLTVWIASLPLAMTMASIEVDMRRLGDGSVFGDIAGDAIVERSSAAAVGNKAELGDAPGNVG